MRKKISPTLFTVSAAAIALLLLASPLLPFPNPLLQPVQAQTTTMTFKTSKAANSEDRNYMLTFDAQGTLSSNFSGYQPMNGTFQINSTSDGGIINSGDIERGRLSNNNQGVVSIILVSRITAIETSCSTSATNSILVDEDLYRGAVECEPVGDTTVQPSSPVTGTAITEDRDSDGDGIPDSSDNCTHNSNPRCFKEGDTSSGTTTHEQQPSSTSPSPSSSSSSGNQTR